MNVDLNVNLGQETVGEKIMIHHASDVKDRSSNEWYSTSRSLVF